MRTVLIDSGKPHHQPWSFRRSQPTNDNHRARPLSIPADAAEQQQRLLPDLVGEASGLAAALVEVASVSVTRFEVLADLIADRSYLGSLFLSKHGTRSVYPITIGIQSGNTPTTIDGLRHESS